MIFPVTIFICGWYIEKELFLVSCLPQAVLQGQSLNSLSVHVRSKELKIVPPAVFGAIHSSIGILDKGIVVRTVFGEDADAKAATNAERVTLDHEFESSSHP